VSNGSDRRSSDRRSMDTKSVVLHLQTYDPQKPIVLHELLYAYHAQKLKDPVEYFAMMASVYLHGAAASDPFTRQAIKEKQPEGYLWMVKEFGPKSP